MTALNNRKLYARIVLLTLLRASKGVGCKEMELLVQGDSKMMEEEEIRKEIDRILRIVEGLPMEYRLKTYEILLKGVLTPPDSMQVVKEKMTTPEELRMPFVVPIDIKAFLAQNQLSEDILWKLFLVQGSEIRPIYKLKTTKKAVAQIQVACLLALENALRDDRFEFSIGTVRDRIREGKAYDRRNFNANFTRKKTLFINLDDDGEHVQLSPAGKTELADIIEEITQ